jgi:hypothetical protein
MSETEPSAPDQGELTEAMRLLTPEERAKLLARVHSLVYWVGILIPEQEVVGDSEIDLREIVYNLTNKEVLTPEEHAQVQELIRALKSKEKVLETQLAKDPLTVDAAKGLVDEVCGLLRAIEQLRSVETVEKAEFRKQELLSRVDDAKRWKKFVDAIKPPA